jgi:hypothetical protein
MAALKKPVDPKLLERYNALPPERRKRVRELARAILKARWDQERPPKKRRG